MEHSRGRDMQAVASASRAASSPGSVRMQMRQQAATSTTLVAAFMRVCAGV
jgi:hypothetical protein